MRSHVSPDGIVAVLAACSLEAAWITLLYILIGSLAIDAPGPLPIIAFAGAVLVGLGFARWSARDERSIRTPVAILVVGAVIVGWLLPLGAAATRLIESPIAVLELHPGGFLLGLAVLRGTAHVTADDDERIAEIALGPGLAAVALIWLLLTLSGGNHEPSTVDAAFSATVTFVAAGLLSMGLARSSGLRDSGALATERRTWVGVLVGVLAGILAVAIPLALVVGVPIDRAIHGALGPVGDVLVPIVSLLLLPVALLGSLLVWLIGTLRSGGTTPPPGPDVNIGPPVIGWGQALGPSGSDAVILGLVPIAIGLIAAYLLVRRFLGQPVSMAVDRDMTEIRQTEGPTGGLRLRLPHVSLPRRHSDPRTASEAYLASLEVLATWPEAARVDSETPTEHARRLRSDPVGPTLGRLAADYALVEFGRRRLTPSEDNRAVERWRRLRAIREKGE